MNGWKNQIISWFLKKQKQKNLFDAQKPKILVVSTTGLGDTLWATPAIKSLREKFPNAWIGALTAPVGKEVLEHQGLDEIFVWKQNFFSLWRLLKRLQKKQIQAVLIFHSSQRLVIPFCSKLGASIVGGFQQQGNKGWDLLLSHPIQKNLNEHEVEARGKLIELLGSKLTYHSCFFSVKEGDRQAVETFLKKNGMIKEKKWIAFHPGAKDFYKTWPAKHFVCLGTLLQEKNFQIFVTGSSLEKDLVQNIASQIPGSFPLCGKFSLGFFGAFLQKMDFFVTNDTGPMHLGAALGVRGLALFSPTDPKKSGPYGNTSMEVFYEKPCCETCSRRTCKENVCMEKILPEKILQKILDKNL